MTIWRILGRTYELIKIFGSSPSWSVLWRGLITNVARNCWVSQSASNGEGNVSSTLLVNIWFAWLCKKLMYNLAFVFTVPCCYVFKKEKWRWLFHQSTVDTKKNGFFDPPVMSFGFLDVMFGGGGTWDTYLQAPKLHLVISHTYGQRVVLTKVAQSAKKDVFKQFWRQK